MTLEELFTLKPALLEVYYKNEKIADYPTFLTQGDMQELEKFLTYSKNDGFRFTLNKRELEGIYYRITDILRKLKTPVTIKDTIMVDADINVSSCSWKSCGKFFVRAYAENVHIIIAELNHCGIPLNKMHLGNNCVWVLENELLIEKTITKSIPVLNPLKVKEYLNKNV